MGTMNSLPLLSSRLSAARSPLTTLLPAPRRESAKFASPKAIKLTFRLPYAVLYSHLPLDERFFTDHCPWYTLGDCVSPSDPRPEPKSAADSSPLHCMYHTKNRIPGSAKRGSCTTISLELRLRGNSIRLEWPRRAADSSQAEK